MPRQEARLAEIEFLARLLDDRFRIPGTSIRFGLDGLVGLIPGLGDASTTVAALFLVYRARQLGVPKVVVARMVANVLADMTIGAIPLLGDIFDIAFKVNRRNLDLMRRHVEMPSSDDAGPRPGAVAEPPLPARARRPRAGRQDRRRASSRRRSGGS